MSLNPWTGGPFHCALDGKVYQFLDHHTMRVVSFTDAVLPETGAYGLQTVSYKLQHNRGVAGSCHLNRDTGKVVVRLCGAAVYAFS